MSTGEKWRIVKITTMTFCQKLLKIDFKKYVFLEENNIIGNNCIIKLIYNSLLRVIQE